MPRDEFVMRGQTANGQTEILNFGSKDGYVFKLLEFSLYASTPSGGETLVGTISAGKTALDPDNVDFRNEGLIATSMVSYNTTALDGQIIHQVINDTFMITHDVHLMVKSLNSGEPINWQCKFKPMKISDVEMANAQLRQFHIFDE